MLTDENKWRALEDMRSRHRELIALIYLTDKQALSLLGLYLTTGIAAGSAAYAGLGVNAILPRAVAAALGGASLLLFIGSIFCFFAMRAADIGLPGRGPEFWTWADHADISFEIVFSAYLKNLEEKSTATRVLNTSMARILGYGKVCGLLAPIAAVLFGGAALWLK